jgi:hypothetical protein
MSLSLQSFHIPKREVWGYVKKREAYEALKNRKRKEKKENETHEGSKVLKRKK